MAIGISPSLTVAGVAAVNYNDLKGPRFNGPKLSKSSLEILQLQRVVGPKIPFSFWLKGTFPMFFLGGIALYHVSV